MLEQTPDAFVAAIKKHGIRSLPIAPGEVLTFSGKELQ
jgi:hypothetical protein